MCVCGGGGGGGGGVVWMCMVFVGKRDDLHPHSRH